MAEQLANDIQTLLVEGISAGATTLKPQSTTGFPAAEFRIRIDDELILVKGVGAEWTIERGVEGTTAAKHEAGATIYHLLTKAALLRVIDESTASDANLAAEESAREAGDALALPKTGGTMTGAITLPGNPGANLQAAPKQYVDSAITALVNGAPGTFDTLKEISDQLKLDEEAETVLIALVAQKLAKSENLADLLNAATARANLGLGTAAVQNSTAFDVAGAAAAAQVASQPLDEDLTKVSALTTTALGLSLLAAVSSEALRTIINAAAAVHASRHQLGGADALSLPQYDPWDSLPGNVPDVPGTTLTPTVKRLYLSRYGVPKKREVKYVRFGVNTAGSAEDKLDAGIYKWVTGNKLERLGSSGVKTVATNSVGPKVVEMTSTVTLEPGVIYYRGFGFETVTGALAILAVLNNQGAVGDIFYGGTSSTPHPSRLYMFKESSVPLPAEITSLAGSTPCLWAIPSES